MKQITILGVLAYCFAIGVAVTSDESISTLKKIDTSRFGKTVLDAIQLQMSTLDAVDNLLVELETMNQGITQQQREDDSQHEVISEECSIDLSRLSIDVNESKGQISSLEEELSEKQPILSQQASLLEVKSNLLLNLQQRLSDLEAHYDQKKDQFQVEKEEHQHAATVIYQARDAIQGNYGRLSLLEVRRPSPTALLQVSEHFAENAKAYEYTRKSWNSFFKVLSSITAAAPIHADTGAIQKVLEIMADLIEKIEESFDIETKAFDSFEADFNLTQDNLLDQVENTSEKIDELDESTSTLSKRIKNAQDELENERERFTQKSVEFGSRNAYCTEENNQYQTRTQGRNEEKEIVSKVIEILKSKSDVIQKYFEQRRESNLE